MLRSMGVLSVSNNALPSRANDINKSLKKAGVIVVSAPDTEKTELELSFLTIHIYWNQLTLDR